MTNKERQKSLDKKKWLESEKKGKDMSAKMEYCFDCDKFIVYKGHEKNMPCVTTRCDASQEERESQCLCATAYNRMMRVSR